MVSITTDVSSMFLVTTAQPRVWPSGVPVLALGEWCLDEDRRRDLDNSAVRMVPYHWDDREALYKDFLYLEDLHERLLPRLADALNALHGLDRPVRYWRLVAGHWFKLYGSVLLDRFRSIDAVARAGLATRTLALPGDGPRTILPTTRHFIMGVCNSDDWNHHCYLDLIEELTDIRVDRLPNTDAELLRVRPRLTSRQVFKSWIKQCATHLTSVGLSDRQALVAFDLQLSVATSLKFGWKLSRHPNMWSPPIVVGEAALQPERRRTLALTAGTTVFERLFGRLVPRFIPTSLVENFSAIKNRALAVFPKRPRRIVTANFHIGNDAACIWAAEQREHGAQFFVAQHGGHYGVDRFEAQEEHELRIADRYFSWGWQRAGHSNIVPMPSMQLSPSRATIGKPAGDVLFIFDVIAPYAYRLFGIPLGGQRQSYVADQIALVSALPEAVRATARFRLHPASELFHFNLRDALEARGWNDRIDDGIRPMHKALASARLCIATANATVFLHTIAMDFPTVLFWNPHFSEIRAEARPYYDALYNAGILHYSFETAARKIAEIFDNPRGWWSDPLIQHVRQRFIAQFGRTSPNWIDEWRRELKR